jgi:integrase
MPRTVAPLTDTEIRKSKKKRLFDGGGLMLERLPSGARVWRLRYVRPNGKRNRISLGAYSEVSLADARDRRDEVRALLRKGLDPASAQRDQKAAERQEAASTFAVVGELWLAAREEKQKAGDISESTLRKARLVVRSYLIPELRHCPISTLTSRRATEAVEKIGTKTPSLAVKARHYLSMIVDFAIDKGLREEGRALSMRRMPKRPKSDGLPAATEPAEIRALIMAIDAYPTPVMRAALTLNMLTAVRPSNVAEAEWAEFDFDHAEWKIPASKMKMEEAHKVCLSTQAIAVLRGMKVYSESKRYVFPPLARQKTEHLHRDSMSKALRDMGFRGKHVTHGFRAMFRTAARERLRISKDVLEIMLAHANKNEVEAAYARETFFDERIEAMQRWADYLDGLRQSASPGADGSE